MEIRSQSPIEPFTVHLLTTPNLVTLSRPVLTVPFVWYVYGLQPTNETACSILFVLYGLIGASDLLDGWLARRLGQTTRFGRLLDHLCDIAFILLALLTYVGRGWVPWWLPASMAWAFIMYMVDSCWRTSGQQHRTLLPTRLGHWGGILYYATVGMVTVDTCLSLTITRLLLQYGWFTAITLIAFVSGLERLLCLLRVTRNRSLAD